jgi:hypothetical protein
MYLASLSYIMSTGVASVPTKVCDVLDKNMIMRDEENRCCRINLGELFVLRQKASRSTEKEKDERDAFAHMTKVRAKCDTASLLSLLLIHGVITGSL